MEIERQVEVGVGDTAILEFHLTGIQQHIKKAVMMRANGLSALIDAEVEAAFTEEKIKAAIKDAVEKEFQRSMQYGEGYQAVRKIVETQVAKTVARLSST